MIRHRASWLLSRLCEAATVAESLELGRWAAKPLQSAEGRGMVTPPPLAQATHEELVLTRKGIVVLVFCVALCFRSLTAGKGLNMSEGVIVGRSLEKLRNRGSWTYVTFPPGALKQFTMGYHCNLPLPAVTFPMIPKAMRLARSGTRRRNPKEAKRNQLSALTSALCAAGRACIPIEKVASRVRATRGGGWTVPRSLGEEACPIHGPTWSRPSATRTALRATAPSGGRQGHLRRAPRRSSAVVKSRRAAAWTTSIRMLARVDNGSRLSRPPLFVNVK